MNAGQLTWTINGTTLNQMKSASPSQMFISPTFDVAKFGWKLVAFPNGKTVDNKGSIGVLVVLVSIPPQFNYIEPCIRIQCNETKSSFTMYRRYRRMKGFGWTRNTMLFSEIKSLDSLSFTVTISVHKIVSIEPPRIYFERRITMKHQRIHWNLDQSVLGSLQRAHSGKSLESPIFDEMWCIRLCRVSSCIYIELQLCALPNGKSTVNISWTVGVEIIENSNRKMTDALTADLGIRDTENGRNRWGMKLLMMEDIANCDALHFNVDITVHDYQRTLDHYSDLRVDSDRERNGEGIGIDGATNQIERRCDLSDARIQSLAAIIDQVMNRLANVQEQSIQRTQRGFDTLQREMMSMKNMLNTNTERYTNDQSYISIEQWLRDIVKLPEYIPNFIDNGFRNMNVVRECTDEILQDIGIKAVGHRMEILLHCKSHRALRETGSVTQKSNIAENVIKGLLRCLIPQPDKSMISKFHSKCNELRRFVESKHSADSMSHNIHEPENKIHISRIKSYIKFNESSTKCTVNKQSSDLMEIYEVKDHQRCPILNGTKGARSRTFIREGTVIGDYAVKYWMESDLETLQTTRRYNEINKYAFDSAVNVEMTLQQIRYFQGTNVDDEEEVREPSNKKRKENEVPHTFKIVLDGHSVEPKGMLCFMNDCRQNLEILQPTEDDRAHLNVKFVKLSQ